MDCGVKPRFDTSNFDVSVDEPVEKGSISILLLPTKKAGGEGATSVKELLLSMRTTEDIVGLSAGSS